MPPLQPAKFLPALRLTSVREQEHHFWQERSAYFAVLADF